MRIKNYLLSLIFSILFIIILPAFNINVFAADVESCLAGIDKSASDIGDCQQIIVVVADGAKAEVQSFEKNGDKWDMKHSANGVVGKEGVSDDAHEGYSATPRGIYDLGFGFGTEDLTDLKIEYRKLTGSEYWVDDPNSSHYNEWVVGNSGKDWKSAEDLKGAGKAYKYVVVVNYNMNPVVKGKGSAIFFHVLTPSLGSGTQGCIAVPESDTLEFMKWLDKDKHPMILNCTKKDEEDGKSKVNSSSDNQDNNQVSVNANQPSVPIGQSNNAAAVSDRSWVDTKDMQRHGGVELTPEELAALANQNPLDNNTTNDPQYDPNMNTFVPGNAQGNCVITLNDGTWFWYHQTKSKCTCKYCGTWTQMHVNGTSEIFGDMGCAVYSSAIITSNISGKEIDPDKWLTELEAVISADKKNVDTKHSQYFASDDPDTGMAIWADAVADHMRKAYAMESTGNIGDLSSDEMKAKVDEVLDKHGMVWFCFESTKGSSNWPFFETPTHLIAIRSHKGDDYYLLDEAVPETDKLNKPTSWSAIYNHLHHDKWIVGFWNPNAGKPNGNPGGFNSTGNIYSDGSKLKKSSNKKNIGGWVEIYDGIPWEAESNTYVFDAEAALKEFVNFVKQTEGTPKTGKGKEWTIDQALNTSRINFDRHSEIEQSKNINFKNQGDGSYAATIDGVKCVAACVEPAVLSKNYNVNFGNFNKNSKTNLWQVHATATPVINYNWGHSKLCAILKNKNDGKVYYMPISMCSAKAHTFPGGLVQTHVKIKYENDTFNNLTTKFNSDGSVNTFGALEIAAGGSSNYTGATPKDMMKVMNLTGNGFSRWDYVWSVLEAWNVPKEARTTINANYTVIGYVVWPNSLAK